MEWIKEVRKREKGPKGLLGNWGGIALWLTVARYLLG